MSTVEKVAERPVWYFARNRVIEAINSHFGGFGEVAKIVETPFSVLRDFIGYTRVPRDLMLRQILPQALTLEQMEQLVAAQDTTGRLGRNRKLTVAHLEQLQLADQAELLQEHCQCCQAALSHD